MRSAPNSVPSPLQCNGTAPALITSNLTSLLSLHSHVTLFLFNYNNTDDNVLTIAWLSSLRKKFAPSALRANVQKLVHSPVMHTDAVLASIFCIF